MYNTPFPESAVFRQATFSDIATVWRIVYNAYSCYIPLLGRTPPTFHEDFDSHIARGNLWLCEKNSSIDAMVVLTPCIKHVLVQAMCVDPCQQGQGLGQDLLSFAETRASMLGLREIKLYTNSLMLRNIKIYRKWGFKQTHTEMYAWGTRVHMKKVLKVKQPVIAALTVA